MHIKANGIEQHYRLSGPEGAAVVVLSHSLAADLTMWDAQMAALEPHFRVLRYDTRGHGRTDAPTGPYTLDQLADDVEALMAALGIAQAAFVGLSMGGMIAQTLAVRGSQRLSRIALCATSSQVPAAARPIWDDRIRMARAQGMAGLAGGTLERWFSASFRQHQPDELARIRKSIEDTPVEGYAGCAAAIAGLDLTVRLSAVHLPTLIIVGRDDPGTPVSASEEIHRRIGTSRLVVVDNAMHLVNIEQAPAFNSALLPFLLDRGALPA